MINNSETPKLTMPSLSIITSDQIKTIDRRIKSCIVENPQEPNDEYYVKLWFNYKDKWGLKTDGRQEFVTNTKENLFQEIHHFFKTENDSWSIV